ncbi:MAG: hypothetical protein P9L89_05885 [Candidatus Celaenobacter polaris]|nr:hypothetical protein [Candidatus Celaenobacter polaris]
METTKAKYKFRAECIKDVLAFRKEAFGKHKNLTVNFDDELPDVTVTMASSEDPKHIEDIMAGLENCHVMLETLNTEANYTGERKRTL